jgi:hypothetical protein
MAMIAFMKGHERFVLERLEQGLDAEDRRTLGEWHDRQLRWMQHERLVHLLVTLAACLFALLALGLTLLRPILPCFVLLGLLTLLAAAYLVHYYRLENRVQRWYELGRRIAGLPR